MTPRRFATCAHERGPGTTVCLRCRHEELLATRSRRRKAGLRFLVRAGAVGLLGAGVVTGVSSLGGIRGRVAEVRAPRVSAPPANRSFAVTQSGELAQPAPAASAATPATAPAIPIGRTELGAGRFALRTGDTVDVSFDTEDARTRRSDKFERVVRETLPTVLGEAGQSAIDRLEVGTLVPAGQLVTLADGGALHLPVGDGRTVRLVPGTRPGRDGPLVVRYRAIIQPAPSAS